MIMSFSMKLQINAAVCLLVVICNVVASQCPTPPVVLTDISSDASSMHKLDAPAGSAYDMAEMIWTGQTDEKRLIAQIHSRGAYNSTVYLSEADNSGYKFELSTGLDGVQISMFERNPKNGMHVLIIGLRGDEYVSCVSKSGGADFSCAPILSNHSPVGTTLFKGDMVLTILRSDSFMDDDTVLVLSKDGGKTWKVIEHYVTAALYLPDTDDSLLALVSEQQSSLGFLSLFSSPKTTVLKKIDISDFPTKFTSSELDSLKKTQVTGVQFAGEFLHVVALDTDGHKVLKISRDNGHSFMDTHLPFTGSGQYINILDTADQLIFAHVTDPTDNTVGTLFTSGDQGQFYSESLTEHVSQDFHKVLSMKGVYMTTQKQPDQSLKTLISLDRGAEWNPITVKDCGQVDCTLQVYGKYLKEEHQAHHHEELANGPQSSANARGLIVVQGMLGQSVPFLSNTKTYEYDTVAKVFVSGDGGYSWIMAPESMIKGPHHIQIEDSGGIIQALPYGDLNNIKFSVDEGTCWFTLPLNHLVLPANFTITGKVAQPGQQALRLGIVGNGGGAWVIIDIDFSHVVPKPCDSNRDYEKWDEHSSCYLGTKNTYNRVKKTSWCHVGSNEDINKPSTDRCACQRKDYECDYGFIKEDGSDDCKKDPKFKETITYCLDSQIFNLVSSGYRLVPGDQCDAEGTGAVTKDTQSKAQATGQACDEGDPGSYLDMETVKLKICGVPTSEQNAASTDQKHHKSLVAATVILTLISAALCVAFTTIYCRYSRLLRQFEYSSLDDVTWRNEGNSSSSSQGLSVSSNNESTRITENTDKNGGKSYSSRMRDVGAESDVDLLNL